MKNFVTTLVFNCVVLRAVQSSGDGSSLHSGMPQVQMFKHAKGVKLSKDTIESSKFLEQKILPVEYWNPPDRAVDDLYFNKKALSDLNDGLFKINGFTDTDIIMMNRWNGLEDREKLWEADMILTMEQTSLYKKHGNVYGNNASIMPSFSKPWPEGNVQFFLENEASVELSDDLQTAMRIWEKAIGCVHFQLDEDMQNITQSKSALHDLSLARARDSTENSDDAVTLTVPPEQTSAAPNSSLPGGGGANRTEEDRAAGLLRVTVGNGCYSTVGWRPHSRLVISERCTLGVLVHLLGHVLGLPHEHSRPDRVLSIDIHPPNVRTRDFLFLNTESGGEPCSNGSAAGWYDLDSVMHLDPYGLSANNLSSMSARDFPSTARMGAAWHQPSFNDIVRLRRPGAYACPPAETADCSAAQPCPGLAGPSCSCVQPAGCGGQPAGLQLGRCGASVRLGGHRSTAAVQQLAPPARRRARACAWLLHAGDACGRVRLTLRLRMEASARVAAAALGCSALQVETLDWDELEGGGNVTNVICLGDFARWRPADRHRWTAEKVVVSASPQLRVLIKSYPATDGALRRVLRSLETHLERDVDKFCHCHLPR